MHGKDSAVFQRTSYNVRLWSAPLAGQAAAAWAVRAFYDGLVWVFEYDVNDMTLQHISALPGQIATVQSYSWLESCLHHSLDIHHRMGPAGY